MTKVLTLKNATETVEIHMLNPGEIFPGFGGSRTGLLVGKTASIVQRRISYMGTVDTELDIHSADFWAWVARLMKGDHGEPLEIIAEQPAAAKPAPRRAKP